MKTSKARVPAQVWPLASYLAEEMKERGWDSIDVALRMENGCPLDRNCLVVQLILAVQKDGLLIDDRTFDGLARAFRVDKKFFRDLDTIWRTHPDRRVKFTCDDDELYIKSSRNLGERAAGEAC